MPAAANTTAPNIASKTSPHPSPPFRTLSPRALPPPVPFNSPLARAAASSTWRRPGAGDALFRPLNMPPQRLRRLAACSFCFIRRLVEATRTAFSPGANFAACVFGKHIQTYTHKKTEDNLKAGVSIKLRCTVRMKAQPLGLIISNAIGITRKPCFDFHSWRFYFVFPHLHGRQVTFFLKVFIRSEDHSYKTPIRERKNKKNVCDHQTNGTVWYFKEGVMYCWYFTAHEYSEKI